MLEQVKTTLETISRKEGELTSFLIYPLLIIVVYEVIMRYVFNAPTTWGFEATTFLYGLHYMFGYAYTDVHDAHVKVDIFTAHLSKKNQAVMREVARKFCNELIQLAREANADALKILTKNGIKFENPSPALIASLQQNAKAIYHKHMNDTYSADLFKKVQDLLLAYRKSS